MRSEAHLPWHDRALPIVRRLPTRRLSLRGWLVVIVAVAANEMRGLGVVSVVVRAWLHH